MSLCHCDMVLWKLLLLILSSIFPWMSRQGGVPCSELISIPYSFHLNKSQPLKSWRSHALFLNFFASFSLDFILLLLLLPPPPFHIPSATLILNQRPKTRPQEWGAVPNFSNFTKFPAVRKKDNEWYVAPPNCPSNLDAQTLGGIFSCFWIMSIDFTFWSKWRGSNYYEELNLIENIWTIWG